LSDLIQYFGVEDIIGDLLRVRAKNIALGEMAVIQNPDNSTFLSRVVELQQDLVSLQVFSGAKGLSNNACVRFLGHPMQVTYSLNILGRVFGGVGQVLDGGPSLATDPKIDLLGPNVNPVMRVSPKNMIHTQIPMIDVFNTLVESQKIPIFSIAGEPYNELLARIGFQADADIVVFGGIGLIFDDYYYFRRIFEEKGVYHRTVMFMNQASDPIVERLLVPDMALAVAERFAVEQGKRVLVLLTDMTAYADALKEIGIALEHIPSNRGYMGDLYSQLATRYEKACDFKGAGSVTILTVTTMPGDDVTHPVPDNTGYITEGQFYLHHGVIDPFGSLSRLKQNVVSKITRDDHSQVMNAMIRFYASAQEAKQKQAMAFDLSRFDQRLLKFDQLFRQRFMDIQVSMVLEDALDLCWQTMAECFEPQQLLIKQSLLERYFPKNVASGISA